MMKLLSLIVRFDAAIISTIDRLVGLEPSADKMNG